MQIVQTVFGVFHHFELARELDRRGHLRRVYSTWPWSRLKREGLPHDKVETFPWLHVPEYLAGRAPMNLTWLQDHLGYANALAFDRWTESHIAGILDQEVHIDALIGISGSSLRAGALVQRNGGIFICDRGSTHQRYQEQILADEFRRWGVDIPPTDPRDTRREEAIYAACDAITVPSTMAARSFADMGVPREKVHVIPYGVRLESFRPTAEPSRDTDATFEVLFAGAVGLRKGIPYLLEAFARLRHPRKLLRVVGSVQEDIRPVLARLPVDDVQFVGSIPQSQLAALMSRSHVLVLPSIEEGLALVQAQAMACGCPVICSTNTGGEDLFTDGVEGFIVPIRDPDALADRLQRLADDPALQHSMREAALRRVQSIGGWKEFGDRWESLLQSLASSIA